MQDVIERKEARLRRILDAVDGSQISTIRSVVLGVISIIRDPKSTALHLKRLIEIDPPLTARILKLSNSSYYAPQAKIDEIDKAIIWIGFDRLKELVIRQKTCSLFEKKESIEGYRRTELWTYCVATAHFAKMIYRREFRERGENIYTAGLLHKIGMIAEEQFLRAAFTKVLKLANQNGQNLVDIERRIFDFAHPELGGRIASFWGLPDDLIAAVTFHHKPYAAPKEHFRLCATLYISGAAARFSELGYSNATPFSDELYQHCLNELKLDQGALNEIIDDGRYEIAEMLEQGVF